MKYIYTNTKKNWQIKRSKYVLCKPNERQLEEALVFITKLLKELGVQYVLTAGTCLGIYRDKMLIQDDDDIDIDILNHDYKQNIKRLLKRLELKKIPFRLGETYNYPKVSMFYNGVKISVVAQVEEENNILMREIYCVPAGYLFPARNTIWKNHDISMPYHTEKYLKHVYGENWRTPEQWKTCDKYNKEYIRGKVKMNVYTKIINKIKTEVNKVFRYNLGVYYIFLP